MTGRCCDYSFKAHGVVNPFTGELLPCPLSRWQALRNRLHRAGWRDWQALIWRWARGYRL